MLDLLRIAGGELKKSSFHAVLCTLQEYIKNREVLLVRIYKCFKLFKFNVHFFWFLKSNIEVHLGET